MEQENQETLPSVADAVEWGMQAMRDNDWQLACERWALLRKHYPSQSPVWVQAAIAHMKLAQFEFSEALLMEARERFPDNPNIYVQQIWLAYETQTWDVVSQRLEELKSHFPNSPLSATIPTEIALKRHDYEKASVENTCGRRAFPKNSSIWHQYVVIAIEQSDWALAWQRCQEYQKHFTHEKRVYRLMAQIAEKQGDMSAAKRYRRAAELGEQWLKDVQTASSEVSIRPPAKRSLGVFLDLVWTKARLNLKSESKNSYLGYLWWVIEPILFMSVFYCVFGLIFQRGGEGFVGFLLAGLVSFQWFAKTIPQMANAILHGKGLMNKVKVSPLFFPLVSLVQNSGKQALVFVLLFSFLAWYTGQPSLTWVSILIVIAVQFVFMASVGVLISLITPFMRDLQKLIPIGIQFLMFISGVFFDVERVPEQWRMFFYANPMACLLREYRRILLENQYPDWHYLVIPLSYAVVCIMIVAFFYRRLESAYPRLVLS